MTINLIQGNCLDKLKELKSKSINCCITSPPYYALRDYNMDEQIGLEDTYQEYIENLVKVFKEVKRLLKDDGTLWLNMGDTYVGTGQKTKDSYLDKKYKNGRSSKKKPLNNRVEGLKRKDLMGMPWRIAFALQDVGFYLRQDIIWYKTNPMPESVSDRCTKAHEYIFLLAKSEKYYFDNESIKEKSNEKIKKHEEHDGFDIRSGLSKMKEQPYRNKRSVWKVNTVPFKESHFATFPPKLIEPMILAGCPEKVCKDCGKAYQKEEIIIPQKIELKEKSNTHGKYKTELNELTHRQGLHANRGTNIMEFRPNLPKQKQFVTFMRDRTNAKILSESTDIPLTKIEHWFRKDKSGFSFPTVEDWNKCSEFVNDWSEEFNDMDRKLSHVEFKTDDVKSVKKKFVLTKQCDCKTNETEPGTVLDPFGGAGTTALVADRLNRNAVSIELNEDYIEITKKRLEKDNSLFLKLSD